MKRLFPLLLAVLLLFGCAAAPATSPATAETAGPQRYQATFLTLFDTVTTIVGRSEEHTSELQSPQFPDLVCRLLLEKKK